MKTESASFTKGRFFLTMLTILFLVAGVALYIALGNPKEFWATAAAGILIGLGVYISFQDYMFGGNLHGHFWSIEREKGGRRIQILAWLVVVTLGFALTVFKAPHEWVAPATLITGAGLFLLWLYQVIRQR